MNIAIVAVAYNRVDSLSRLLNSLENAYYPNNEKVTLIISVDKSNTKVVEKYADSYQWLFGNKIVDKHNKNLGLRPHMISLGKWFDTFDAIVVLEDDLVVSPNFYTYTEQAVKKYMNVPEIAGISLYSYRVNYQTRVPFDPIKDEYDAYFMNCAMSWGEIWMRDSWNLFYDWYLQHQEFPILPHLPYCICSWNAKSWLKYHTRYCIEENKFFVYPYVSLTTNYGDAGEHSNGSGDTLFQVLIQEGRKMNYHLPSFGQIATYYDGFFENRKLYQTLNYQEEELCLDLQCENNNRLKRRFWLTPQIADYRIVSSFGLKYRPIEKNVIANNPGESIFLYDTSVIERNNHQKTPSFMRFHFRIINLFYFVRRYKWKYFWADMFYAIKGKIHSFK